MLTNAARHSMRGLARAIGQTTWSFRSDASRAYASSASTETAAVKPKRRYGWYLLGGLAIIGTGAYVGDLIVNDDLDQLSDRFRKRLSPEEQQDRPKVVILGSGWGAMSALRTIHTDKFNVTVVSPRNYFLFTPLLASTTSGLLEVHSIMDPIRKFCQRGGRQEARYIEMHATHVDPVNKTVTCVDNSAIRGAKTELVLDYDYLIMSVGAETATFNIPGVADHAIYMKSIDDSKRLRDTVIDCFETAMIPGQPSEEIDRLLHFVIAGGGPAGVECTAELHDFIMKELSKTFPQVAGRVRVSLVEALPKILPMFDSKLVEYTEAKLNATREVKVWTKRAVTKVEQKQITLKNMDTGELQVIPYGALLWATGNSPVPLTKNLIRDLGREHQSMNRGLIVDEHMRVRGSDSIFAIGDCALCGKLPPTAQVAQQQGKFIGRLFNDHADDIYQDTLENRRRARAIAKANGNGKASPVITAATTAAANTWYSQLDESNRFLFKYFGSMAYIGGMEAVADFGPGSGKYAGVSTWLLWRSVYLSKLLSVRNRVLVAADWTKTILFGRDISRG